MQTSIFKIPPPDCIKLCGSLAFEIFCIGIKVKLPDKRIALGSIYKPGNLPEMWTKNNWNDMFYNSYHNHVKSAAEKFLNIGNMRIYNF